MKKNISSNDCRFIFTDKFNMLTMKDIGIELKHFSMGTAPEKPSFLVNQDDLKKKIIEKFSGFFDENMSQGLEVIFLKSNYGNGKSHFIRMIYTFLNEYENVIARRVSLKQEETDLKKKILESISQKKLKECSEFIVETALEDAVKDEKDAVLLSVAEKYNVSAKLSQIIYEAARSNEITKQVQAISILKGNYLPSYLKSFDCKSKDLNNDFYYNVIRLISVYLKETTHYLVVVFDEYEHVFSWRSSEARKSLYQDIKLFSDHIDTFSNLFFVFAESDSVENRTESMDDPAFVSRKSNLTYQIADISSEDEVEKLFGMILKRYQKYYSISFEDCKVEILQSVYEDSSVKTKTNYRGYTQAIMRALDQFRNQPPKTKKSKKIRLIKKEEMNDNIEDRKAEETRIAKWKNATSISRKTILCELLENMLVNVGEQIISRSRKRGEYATSFGNVRKKYYVISTDNPSIKDIIKRYEAISSEKADEDLLYILYPAIEGELYVEIDGKLVCYDANTIKAAFKSIYEDKVTYDNIESYLEILNRRSDNAKEN